MSDIGAALLKRSWLKKGPMEKSSTCRFRIVNNNLGCHIIYSPFIWFLSSNDLQINPLTLSMKSALNQLTVCIKEIWLIFEFILQHIGHNREEWDDPTLWPVGWVSVKVHRDKIFRILWGSLFIGELNFCCTLSCLQERGNRFCCCVDKEEQHMLKWFWHTDFMTLYVMQYYSP